MATALGVSGEGSEMVGSPVDTDLGVSLTLVGSVTILAGGGLGRSEYPGHHFLNELIHEDTSTAGDEGVAGDSTARSTDALEKSREPYEQVPVRSRSD